MPLDDKLPSAVRNEFFYFIARACGILATCIFLPAAGYMLTRVIAKADEISDQVTKQSVTIQLLSSEVKYRFDNLSDHEHRIRALEKSKP